MHPGKKQLALTAVAGGLTSIISWLGVRSALSPGDANYWFLAYLLPVILLVLAWYARREVSGEKWPAQRLVDMTCVAVLILALVSVGWYAKEGKRDLDAQINPDQIGACWAESDESMIAVDCSNPQAGFVVDRYEDMWQKCDDYFIPSAKGDKYLCLSPRA